jgi:hypothetical protein
LRFVQEVLPEKELTRDDASLKELEEWCINNPNDTLTLQLKKMMQNMFADKKTFIPDTILPSTKDHTGEKMIQYQ